MSSYWQVSAVLTANISLKDGTKISSSFSSTATDSVEKVALNIAYNDVIAQLQNSVVSYSNISQINNCVKTNSLYFCNCPNKNFSCML